MRLKHASGVRQNLSVTPWQRFNQWLTTRRLRSVGAGTFIDFDVRFLRHPQNVQLGANVIVKEGARICPAQPAARIEIGDWTTVGYHTFIFASAGISIGPNCLIAPFCYLVDSNHGIHRESLIREQPMTATPIVIHEDVWLGVRSVVLRGVEIGRGAVVSAGSVVTQSVPEYAIVAGNPAAVVGERR